jgi:hypothetical protein
MTVFSRPSSILPESFSSPLAINGDHSHRQIIYEQWKDDTGDNIETPSPLGYHIVLSKIAYIIHRHVRCVKRSPENIFKALQRIDEISGNLPPHLKDSVYSGPPSVYQGPHWTDVQSVLLANLIEVCHINLCFWCLPQLLEIGHDEHNLQACGLQSAMRIVERQYQAPLNMTKKFWATAASLTAAGVFLILDLMCFESTKSDALVSIQLKTINSCIQIIRDITPSKTNGSDILRRLLHIYDASFPGPIVDKKMLLSIMNFAAISTTQPTTADNNTNTEGETSNFTANPFLEIDLDHVQLSKQASAMLDGQFDSSDMLNTFDLGFTMDLDYMTFNIGESMMGNEVMGTDFEDPAIFPYNSMQ